MFYAKNLILALTFVLATCCVSCQDPSQEGRCRSCDMSPFLECEKEGPVYATDGTRCYEFKNFCEFEDENCKRINRCQGPLKQISKDECIELRPLCEDKCPDEFRSEICDKEGEEVFAYDAKLGICYYFETECKFKLETCDRLRNCQNELRIINKEEWLKSCPNCTTECPTRRNCSSTGPRICVAAGEKCKCFENECDMKRAECENINNCMGPFVIRDEKECTSNNCGCSRTSEECNSFYAGYLICSNDIKPMYYMDWNELKCYMFYTECQYYEDKCKREKNCLPPLTEVKECYDNTCTPSCTDSATMCLRTIVDEQWYSDGTTCERYPNSCLVRAAQCQRQNKCLPPLVPCCNQTCSFECPKRCDSRKCFTELWCAKDEFGCRQYKSCEDFQADNCKRIREGCKNTLTRVPCDKNCFNFAANRKAGCSYCTDDWTTIFSKVKGPPVYATDGTYCYAYRNKYELQNINCKIDRDCDRPQWTIVENCHDICCKINCDGVEQCPICAYDGISFMEFPNDCERKKYNCGLLGNLMNLYANGTCPFR